MGNACGFAFTLIAEPEVQPDFVFGLTLHEIPLLVQRKAKGPP
jgi:hypothetical protein